ncbi:MAG: hypothetical protein AB8U31_00025 [Anaplasma ovis]
MVYLQGLLILLLLMIQLLRLYAALYYNLALTSLPSRNASSYR